MRTIKTVKVYRVISEVHGFKNPYGFYLNKKDAESALKKAKAGAISNDENGWAWIEETEETENAAEYLVSH